MRRWLWIGVALFLLAGLGVYLVSTSQAGAFDSELWKAQRGTGADKNPRVGMVVELKKKHLREGMTREDVQKLLGEPDQRRGTSEVYELGMSPVGVSYEYLVIDYDGQGKVMRFRVTRS
ncbi:outer membrane protein assembly factor BamE [Pyxidicoccus trucidator]|uniref:outer membrane protein assembly factor BamE n=1 Tax=Pyxidicoccus trucidator TaxID=2709662 RepID=UPI0013D9B11E|nr:outer membrane protein assembly factor BamE [Pyxidicoccus trucidator]